MLLRLIASAATASPAVLCATVAALVAASAAGCDGGRRIEIIVCGDVALPGSESPLCDETPGGSDPLADVATISVEATSELGEVIYNTTADMCNWDLPFTASIYTGWDSVTVEVTGWGSEGLVKSVARPTFPASGVKEIHMGLTQDCLNVQCLEGRTCVDGGCEVISEGWGSRICR